MAQHFFKTLIIFIGMIIIGLVGVFLVTHFDKSDGGVNIPNNQTQVAK